jgi:hypothetical protein
MTPLLLCAAPYCGRAAGRQLSPTPPACCRRCCCAAAAAYFAFRFLLHLVCSYAVKVRTQDSDPLLKPPNLLQPRLLLECYAGQWSVLLRHSCWQATQLLLLTTYFFFFASSFALSVATL